MSTVHNKKISLKVITEGLTVAIHRTFKLQKLTQSSAQSKIRVLNVEIRCQFQTEDPAFLIIQIMLAINFQDAK